MSAIITLLAVTFLAVNAEFVSEQQFQKAQQIQQEQISQLNRENMALAAEIAEIREANQQLRVLVEKFMKTYDEKSKMFEDLQPLPDFQNATIEERVSLLEIQMTDVQGEVTDLDQDVNFLFDEQVIQDERLLNLEERALNLETETEGIEEEVEVLQDVTAVLDFRVTALEESGGSDGNSSIAALEVRVETLEGTVTDHETRITAAEENIQGLQVTDVSLDERITVLEESDGNGGGNNETIAFYAVLTSYDTIEEGSTVIYNVIITNEGEGYESSTGVFTVPSGGDGWYYLSHYILGPDNEYSILEIEVNDNPVCTAVSEINDNPGDPQQGVCSAVAYLVEGDEVKVVYAAGTDNTPLFVNTEWLYNGFSGFRI